MIKVITEGKKVTESFFREEFYDWYNSYPDVSEIEQYIEDEGMPDMVSDLSIPDIENILNHFDPDRLEDIYAQENEGKELGESVLTESRNVTIGLYGDDCGSYGSLDVLLRALKSAGLKVTEFSGNEDYGWEFNVSGDAKKIFKMIDGEVPGYNCEDVQDFVDQYEIEVDEDHEGDPTDYAWRGVPDDFDPNEVDESCKKITEWRDDWYYDLSKEDKEQVNHLIDITYGKGTMLDDLDEDDMDWLQDKLAEIKNESLNEETVRKSNGKWTNKGKNGEHGEFKTKKAADAQRKAMFANGYKAEALGSPDHPAWLDEEDDYPDEGTDTSVSEGNIFVEDGTEYEWYTPYGDVKYLDFDAWQVWEAVPTEEDEFRSVFFVVDIDTGFIDWGPCDTAREALDFLRSKVDDYNSDL